MWFLIVMTLVNSILHQQRVQIVYRISLGIIQLGVVEFLIAFGFFLMLLRGSRYRAMFPTLRTHPVLVWMVGSLFLGGICGIFGGLLAGNVMKYVLSSAREFFVLPICVLIGYRLIGTPKHVKTMAIVMLIAGVMTSLALFWSFGEKSERSDLINFSINDIRGIILYWNAEYAPVTAIVLIFVVLTRFPLWRQWICILVGLFCYIGYATTISRVGFVILLFGTASTFLLLPKGDRMRKFVRAGIFMPILAVSVWGALNLGDAIIGRGFAGKVQKHAETLLPGERETTTSEKAWDSRLGGIATELWIWSKNPLIGSGFGAGETAFLGGKLGGGYVSIKHNGWTAVLAETGIFGFVGLFLLIFSLLILGYRMVHDRVDYAYMLFGAVGFATGVVHFLRCCATMSVTSRAGLQFALVCGMLIRAREIQETHAALAYQEEQSFDPYIDEHTGMLVPDYAAGLDAYYGYN